MIEINHFLDSQKSQLEGLIASPISSVLPTEMQDALQMN